MESSDDILASARAVLQRSREDAPAPQPRRVRQRTGRSRKPLLVALAAFVVTFMLFGFVAAGLVLALTLSAMLLLPNAKVPPAPPPAEKLRTIDLRALPAQTDRWLRAQRPALPAPAQVLIDRIGERLDVLSPQLGRVPADGEEAGEIRRLVGEQLPAFVADYGRVPAPLRRTARGGRTPDAALADGLAVVEREIAAMTERLARSDIDSLQTRGRFLEMKYEGREE